ncbi:hypothetical protein EVAR_720_1 [Eumeta japonica]|uniref:ATP-dependent DNA helicase n=1 Tax=Eumeta variegata TaxID=151549 RepID=A0A4C1SBM0_EUMVA|nr:hypothetical protein EVAR_720_1 [Eumeta japonica]
MVSPAVPSTCPTETLVPDVIIALTTTAASVLDPHWVDVESVGSKPLQLDSTQTWYKDCGRVRLSRGVTSREPETRKAAIITSKFGLNEGNFSAWNSIRHVSAAVKRHYAVLGFRPAGGQQRSARPGIAAVDVARETISRGRVLSPGTAADVPGYKGRETDEEREGREKSKEREKYCSESGTGSQNMSRQTLPVIERGTAADDINVCLKASYLWTKLEKFYLTTNMRIQLFSDVESESYSQKLLEIGEGHLHINQEGLTKSFGTPWGSSYYPMQFLNSLELSGVLPHKLELKVGVRFVNTPKLDAPRLCNGTQLRVIELGKAYCEGHNLNCRRQGRQCSYTTYPNHTQ